MAKREVIEALEGIIALAALIRPTLSFCAWFSR